MKRFGFLVSLWGALAFAERRYVFEVPAQSKEERTLRSNLGFAIDEAHSDRVFFTGTENDLRRLTISDLSFSKSVGRDSAFNYNYQENSIFLGRLAAENILFRAEHNLWKVPFESEVVEEKQGVLLPFKKSG